MGLASEPQALQQADRCPVIGITVRNDAVQLQLAKKKVNHGRGGLPLDRRIVLSSFGGYGLASLPLEDLDCLETYDVVIAEVGRWVNLMDADAAKRKQNLQGAYILTIPILNPSAGINLQLWETGDPHTG